MPSDTMEDMTLRARPLRGPGLRCAACLLTVVASGACDDPFEVDWIAFPDTAFIYALTAPTPHLPSGFNFELRRAIFVEAPGSTGRWDMALDRQGEQLVVLPPRALGVDSRARIATLPGLTFNEVVEAPADTAAYVSDAPIPVELGTVYVVQTSEVQGAFGQRCVFYGKFEPLEVDVPGGRLTFLYDASPICNDPRLVPPDG